MTTPYAVSTNIGSVSYNNYVTSSAYDALSAASISMGPTLTFLTQLFIQTKMTNETIKMHKLKSQNKKFCYEIRSKQYRKVFSEDIKESMSFNTYAFSLLMANAMTKLLRECQWKLEYDYKDKNLLKSGWLIGEKKIAKKAA